MAKLQKRSQYTCHLLLYSTQGKRNFIQTPVAMATPPPKPWKASSRSSCNFRRTRMWDHGSCVLRKANQLHSNMDDVEGIDSLRWEDQQKTRKYIDGGDGGGPSSTMQCGIEVSQTCRATCKCCGQKIVKGQVRISSKSRAKGVSWHHANCFMELHLCVQVQKFSGWDYLPPSDQEAVLVHAKAGAAKGKEDEDVQKPTSKAGAKHKKDDGDDNTQKLKTANKADGNESISRDKSAKNADDLEAQSKPLWALKDDDHFKLLGSGRTNSTGSSSKFSTSSKSARPSGASMISDARWPEGASRPDVDEWDEYWAPRLADAIAALYSAKPKLVLTPAEVHQVSAQFRRAPNRVGIRIFLQLPAPHQVRLIREMLANSPVV